jgi:HlyD family secretion protein
VRLSTHRPGRSQENHSCSGPRGRHGSKGPGSARSSRAGRTLQTGVLVLAILVPAFSAGCGRRTPPGEILSSGFVEATEVRVSAKVGGTVVFLAAGEGDRVQAGQLLARLDSVDVVLALNAARGDRDQAAADLRLRLAGTRAEEIREAAAQLDRAQAELDGAERDRARMQALLDAGSGTEKARDDASTRRDLARAGRDAAREQLQKRKNGSRPEEIEAARARLASLEARVAQLEQQREDTSIESPGPGVLTARLIETGELVTAGAGICVITDLLHPWLTAYIGELDLGRIRLGDAADVVTDDGQKRTGTISFISDRAEFTPRNAQTRHEREKLVFRVKVSLENKDGLFKPGMPAEARFRAVAGKP